MSRNFKYQCKAEMLKRYLIDRTRLIELGCVKSHAVMKRAAFIYVWWINFSSQNVVVD